MRNFPLQHVLPQNDAPRHEERLQADLRVHDARAHPDAPRGVPDPERARVAALRALKVHGDETARDAHVHEQPEASERGPGLQVR